jgi:hypothetical protein
MKTYFLPTVAALILSLCASLAHAQAAPGTVLGEKLNLGDIILTTTDPGITENVGGEFLREDWSARPRPFADYYSFTIVDPVSFAARIRPDNDPRSYLVNGFNVGLFTGTAPSEQKVFTTLLNEDAADSSYSFLRAGRHMSIDLLAPGDYFIAVSGRVANRASIGGAYEGWVKFESLVATPVPEPGTWAMLGLGVGMIGFALRRKMR